MIQWPLGIMRSALISVALLLTGCGVMSPSVQIASQPTVRPAAAQTAAPEPPKPGAIYASNNFRPLFENRRARHPGDILLIKIAEKTTATPKIKQQRKQKRLAQWVDFRSAFYLCG